MAEQSNVSARLREGIDAAKRGDKITARRLLQQVLGIDGDNELALMWMASVVDALNERRFYLERALSVNPNNARAREALRRLGVEEPQPRRAPTPTANDYVRNVPRSGGGTNLYLIAAAVVAFVVIAVVVAAVVSSLQPQTTITPVAPQDVQQTFAAFVDPTATATTPRRAPTETVFAGVIVTLDPNQMTPLPPTFTPTFTPPPSATPEPSITPVPLHDLAIVYSDIERGASLPSLYSGNADGTGEIKLLSGDSGGFEDVALDPSGQQLVFVRVVASGDSPGSPQLFVAPVASPEDAQEITTLTATGVAHPRWSPDGKQIVFSSVTEPDDEEIWLINADGSRPVQLTNNDARDFDPQFSPDGTQIVFASDVDSPGFSEIYVMDTNGNDITRLTDVPNCYSPAWSPDGTRIAYVSDQQGDGDIYVMDADGQRPFLVTQDDNGAEDRDPVWSPDGSWILFASNRDDEQFRWYAIDLHGDAQPVTATGRDPVALSFVSR